MRKIKYVGGGRQMPETARFDVRVPELVPDKANGPAIKRNADGSPAIKAEHRIDRVSRGEVIQVPDAIADWLLQEPANWQAADPPPAKPPRVKRTRALADATNTEPDKPSKPPESEKSAAKPAAKE